MDYQIMAIALAVVVVGFVGMKWERVSALKKLKKSLRSEYGKKANKKKVDFDKIRIYWDATSADQRGDEKVDDITWNDLEMDKVFHRMNACCSFIGEQFLYAFLHKLPKKETSFKEKVNQMSVQEDLRLFLQLQFSYLGTGKEGYQIPSFIKNLKSKRIPKLWAYRLMQGALLGTVSAAAIFRSPTFLLLGIVVFCLNLVIYTRSKWRFESRIEILAHLIGVIALGNAIVKDRRYQGVTELEAKLTPFSGIIKNSAMIQRKNNVAFSLDAFLMLFDYVMGGTLLDFTQYDRIVRTLEEKENEFFALYDAIGEIDAAISVASFRESLPHYSETTFNEDSKVWVSEIYHPLIDQPVCNSQLLSKSCLVSGSNASGKSTYIKAVAINAILAQNIYTCTAKEMALPKAHVITSMAVRDDLMEGESYYIKEIKYLNRIIQALSEERFVICVIDEILRGTNTDERIAASAAILEFVTAHHCLAIVASHDLELTQMLEGSFENYHFRERMLESDDDVAFEYKLHAGVASSRNAIRLLEHVGFPVSVVTNAKAYFNGRV